MDLAKILANIEGKDELIKQIEQEVGREYVPRSEFNKKNDELKSLEKQVGDLSTNIDSLTKEKATSDSTIKELTGKVTTYETDSLKAKIAREKGIPYELAGRLSGSDEKALREDAEILSKLVNSKPPQPLRTNEPAGKTTTNNDDAYAALISGLKGE